MIAVIDYDAGNTFNGAKAVKHLGVEAVLTADPDTILKADGVVLPGVGAFKSAMDTLKERGLVDLIHQVVDKGTPLLGICLGMQMLVESSDEYGPTEGLGLIPGHVCLIPEDLGYMVPQMGWNQNNLHKEDSIFADVVKDQYTYFVHSYFADCPQEYVTTTVDYGVAVPGIVEKGKVYGMQFHPEKSAALGLALLKRFVEQTQA